MKVRRRTATGFTWPRLSRLLPARRHPSPDGRDRRWFIGAFATAMVLGYLVAAVAIFPAPIFITSTTVPNLLGLTEEEAIDLLAAGALTAGDVEYVNHPSTERGKIVWQDPPSSMVVPEGIGVQLSVSQGKHLVPVPDVANYTGYLAALLIESSGLAVRVESIQTAAPRGLAVNTRPATGTTRRPGDTITLLISVGAPTIAVPNLLGLTLEQARDTLQALDLAMGNFTAGRSRTQEPGTIFQQAPPAGTLAAPGTRVTGWVVRQNR